MANRFLNNITINDQYTFPSTDGSANQIIQTDGAGQLSFVDNTSTATSAEKVSLEVRFEEAVSKGDPVYVSGFHGSNGPVKVSKARSDDSDKMPAFGLADDDYAQNAEGHAISLGNLDDVDTSSYSIGDTLYVAPTGGLTDTKPTGSNLIQNVGTVSRSNANNGSIEVTATGRSNDVPNLSTGKIWVGTANNTAESGVVHLDETNNRVGIGTTNPGFVLDVVGEGNFSSHLNVNSSTGIRSTGWIHLHRHASDSNVAVGNNGTNVDLIIPNGNVGIGTNSPQTKLHVKKNSNVRLRLETTSTGTSTIQFADSDDGNIGIIQYNHSVDAMYFEVNNAERMRINSSGNVGIGTTSPTAPLHIQQPSTSGLKFSRTGHDDIDLSLEGSNRFVISNTTDGLDLMALMYDTGRVGIGTTSPAYKLDVSGTIRGSEVHTNAHTFTSANSTFNSTNTNINSTNIVVGNNTTDNVYIGQNTLNVLGGDVGIGTTSPDESLHVNGNIKGNILYALDDVVVADKILHYGDTDTYIGFEDNTQRFFAAGEEMIKFNSSIVTINEASGNNDLRVKGNTDNNLFYTDGSTDRVGIGTASPSQKLDVSGNIKMTETAASSDTDKFVVLDSGVLKYRTGANVLSDIGAAASSHNHDDRYYTESEMQTFFNRGYISSQGATNLAAGWYTIATNTGNRALGEFQIWDVASSRHQSVLFNASHHYGVDNSNDITVLANSRYDIDVFRYIRIKENGTYDGAALQVYIENSTNAVYVAITGANAQSAGWVLKDWIADATDPGDVDNYSSFTEKCKIDLDNIRNGGIATTGDIFSGGATTQYRNLTTDDEGSGNGLDADTLDGQHASAFQAAGTYNTVIGTDADISYTGATVLSTMTMTDGVVQSHSSRNLTASDIGAAASSHNHTSLTGVTSLAFAAQSSDSASITTTIDGTHTYFDFNLTDDNNNDWWRWRFTPSGSTVYDAMTLKPASNGNANLTVSGNITADNLNISNWDTAYGWGDHASVGYLEDYTETDTLATVTARGASTTTALTLGTITLDQVNMKDMGDFITFYGNDNSHHGIGSRDVAGNASDDLRINSYHNVYFNLDSNNNNTNATTGIYVGQHGSATGAIQNTWSFYSQTDGITFSSGSFRAPIFYDSNDTTYYLDPASTGTSVNVRGVIQNPSVWINDGDDYNSYNENIRLFNAANNVSVIAFSATGTEGVPTTSILGYSDRFETRVGNTWRTRLYGGYLEVNGDARATLFYDSNDTNYYGNFAGNSRYNTAQGNYLGLGTAANTSGSYRLNMGGSVDMNANNIDYVSQLHFNDNVRFYDDGNDSYLNFKYGDATTGGIKFYNGGGTLKGYVYANNDGFGLLDSDGSWALRSPVGGSGLELRSNNNVEFTVNDDHTLSHGSSRAPIFYDSDNTSYYVDPANTTKAAYLRGDVEIINELPLLELNDYTATNNTNLNAWVSFQRNGTEAGYVGYGSGTTDYLYLSNFSGRVSINGSFTEHANSSRAPIFYDSDNTGYYLNAANNGIALKINGIINQDFQVTDLNSAWTAPGTSRTQGFIFGRFQSSASNAPSTNDNANWFANIYSHASGGTASYGIQLAGANASSGDNSLQLRTVSNGTFSSWRKIYHEGHKPTLAEIGAAASAHNHAASDITSGTLATARIPNLAASKITSGTLATARLPEFIEERYIYNSNDSNGVFMPMVKGGMYATTASSVTGAIKVTLPSYKSGMMFTIYVDIYEYTVGETVTFRVSGYAYSDAGATWHNCSVVNLADNTDRNYTVRFYSDTTNNAQYFTIGETNSTWAYPQVNLRDFWGGYSTSESDALDEWDVEFVTSFTGDLRHTFSDNFVAADWDRIRDKPSTFTPSSHNHAASNITSGTFADARIALTNITQHTDPKYLRSNANDSFTGNELHFPTLDLSISNNNSQNQGNTYFRGDGTHFVLGLNAGNTLYLNYGNSTGGFRAYGGTMYWNDSAVGTPWGSSNDGSGSGLDADTLDGQHASAFLTSYAETDTLDSVADRGRTTNQQLISTNTSGFRVDSGSYARIEIDSSDNWSYIRLQDNAVTSWDIASHNGGNLELRPAGSSSNRTYFDSGGNSFSEGSKRAPVFYDSNNTGYYLNPASTSNINALTLGGVLTSHTGQTRDKIRVWNSSPYTIGMKSGFTYGHLNDYAMSFQMNSDNDRGFWWGDDGHSDAQGAMSLTTNGRLTVATSISVGQGESVTSASLTPLYVNGNATVTGDLYMDNGRIYDVEDIRLNDQIYHDGDENTYIQFHAADQWRVVTGGTERLEVNNSAVTTSGRLNVGEHVLATGNVYSSGGNGFVFGSSTSEGEYIQRVGNDIRFVAGGSTRMTIDGDNLRVGIGVTDPLAEFHVRQASSGRTWSMHANTVAVFENSASAYLQIITGNSNEGEIWFSDAAGQNRGRVRYEHANDKMEFWTAGVERAFIDSSANLHVDGDVVAYSTSISDIRLKDNINTIDSALDKVKKLRGVEYTWNTGSRKDKKDLGVIAQEVEEVLPEIVHEHKMDLIDEQVYKTVDYEKITAVLIEAIKEQQKQIDELKSIINGSSRIR